MFAKLLNELTLTFKLRNEGPLLINSGTTAKIMPRTDMSFVRTMRDGAETIYIPGSSIKGVFRTRYEQIMRALGQDVCDTFDYKDSRTCNKKIRIQENKPEVRKHLNGAERYALCCEACKLFGTLVLGGRITFADAYPVGEWKMGIRNGVGIDRITGAAFPGALYEIEALEAGTFAVRCKMTNFKLYQLRTIIWVLEDINEGLVTFGMGGSRGNGQMRIAGGGGSSRDDGGDRGEDVELVYRKFADCAPNLFGEESDALFGKQVRITGLSEIIASININTKDELIAAIKSEVA